MSQQPATHTKDSPDPSSQIINAALELFSQHGYGGVRTSDIAKLAGTSRPSIHYHFKNKQELWKATMQALINRVENSTHFLTVIDSGLQGLDGLKTFYRSLLHVHFEIPELGRIMFLEGIAKSERLDWLGGILFKNTNEIAFRLINECIASGDFKPYKPEQIKMLMNGAAATYFNLSSYIYSLYEHDSYQPENAKDFEKMYMDTIFSGLIR